MPNHALSCSVALLNARQQDHYDAPTELDPGGGARAVGTAANGYRDHIEALLRADGLHGMVDARHVEAWMRCERPTLDGLSVEAFEQLYAECAGCVVAATTNVSERLAQSFGLMAVVG